MSQTELLLQLRQQPFTPFDIVSSSGERYRVRHPELVRVTGRRSVYVFDSRDARGVSPQPDIVSLLHIAAIEPLRGEANQPARI